tara:strand:- start:30 stop:902 length:873 start_codon:yes stop_codon:yes gene_type:complete
MPISNPVYDLQGQSGGTTPIDTVTDPLQIIGTDLSIKNLQIDTTSTTGTVIANTTDVNQVTITSNIIRTLPPAADKFAKYVTVTNLPASTANTTVTVNGASSTITLYPTESSTFFSDGTTWTVTNSVQRPLIGSSTSNLSSSNSQNTTMGNHAPFNALLSSINTHNLLVHGTASYVTTPGVLCIGRVLLKSGYIYSITGVISTLSPSPFFGYAIYNATTNVRIGTRGDGFANATQDASVQSAPSFAILSVPTNDTLVELQLTGGTIPQWYPGNNNLSETSMTIQVVGRIS